MKNASMKDAETTQAVLIDGKFYIKQTDGSLRPGEDRSDWAKVHAMTDEEIEAAAMSDPDNLPFSDAEWTKVVKIQAKQYIHLGVDADILNWFRQEGRGYQTRINAVLRRYVEARRKAG